MAGLLIFESERLAARAGYHVFDRDENRREPSATTIRVRTRTSAGWAIALARIIPAAA